MKISRALVTNYLKNHGSPREEPEAINFPRLFQQGKQISQIVSYIWRWSDAVEKSAEAGKKKETAIKLGKYFKKPFIGDGSNEEPFQAKLRNLFSAEPDPNGGAEAKLLYDVFPIAKDEDGNYPDGYFFPIFSDLERVCYHFTIDTNNSQGTLEDANVNNPQFMTLVTPYPPCPKFSETTITEKELDDWISDRNPKKMIADNLYIPTCTS